MHGTWKLKFPIFLLALPSAQEDCNPSEQHYCKISSPISTDRPKLFACPPCTSMQTNLTAILKPWQPALLRPRVSESDTCSQGRLQPCQRLLSPICRLLFNLLHHSKSLAVIGARLQTTYPDKSFPPAWCFPFRYISHPC